MQKLQTFKMFQILAQPVHQSSQYVSIGLGSNDSSNLYESHGLIRHGLVFMTQ